MKKLICLVFLLSLFLWTPVPSYAQQATACAMTKIGNPQTAPVPPAGCETTNSQANSSILTWASQIASSLEKGYDNFLDRQQADICNTNNYCAHKQDGTSADTTYWCTFIVIDSYNLAGIKGLTTDAHLAVINMMSFWKNTSGYVFYPYDPDNPSSEANKTTLGKVTPGMAFFFADDPTTTQEREHTGLIKEITIDTHGNGKIVSIESNSTEFTHTFPIENWDVKGTFYKLRGFGGTS